MILEHAVLPVIPGQEAEFEATFGRAKSIISSMPGFISLRLSRCIERTNQYLLLIEWERLEDHTEGFRGSDQYQQWRTLLHNFYDPFPAVDHYETTANILSTTDNLVSTSTLNPAETAERYFAFSNKSDFEGIKQLLTETTTYASQNTGMYMGSVDIIAMQQAFHGKFSSLAWTINSVEETRPGIVLFDYDFVGEMPNGETVESSGLEYVTVHQGKIQHIEIRNKP